MVKTTNGIVQGPPHDAAKQRFFAEGHDENAEGNPGDRPQLFHPAQEH
jgi:hypothetical protein